MVAAAFVFPYMVLGQRFSYRVLIVTQFSTYVLEASGIWFGPSLFWVEARDGANNVSFLFGFSCKQQTKQTTTNHLGILKETPILVHSPWPRSSPLQNDAARRPALRLQSLLPGEALLAFAAGACGEAWPT